MKKYRITTTHTILASSQEEALAKVARIVAKKPSTQDKEKNQEIAESVCEGLTETALSFNKRYCSEDNMFFAVWYSPTNFTIMSQTALVKFFDNLTKLVIKVVGNDGAKLSVMTSDMEVSTPVTAQEVYEIWLALIIRMRFCIVLKNAKAEETLNEVFNKTEVIDFATGENESKALCGKFSRKNLKPKYVTDVDNWVVLFKVLKKASI
jgi:hypothetical protein